MILISCVSAIGQILYNILLDSSLINYKIIFDNLKIYVKICITPITMTINFL